MSSRSSSAAEGRYALSEKTSETDDQRIKDVTPLPPPEHLIRFFPIAGTPVEKLIGHTRNAIRHIMQRKDDRLLVIIGPCSIHDPAAALDYARRLLPLREQYADTLEIVMRVYFEKPRTTVGWKGLINDPYLDESYRIDEGLRIARQLLVEINRLGMPAGSEFLDVISPQYIGDLISLGRDRRAHHRKPGAPRAGLGPERADRLQERHRRQHPHRHRRHPGRGARAPLPVGAQERPGGHRRDQGQQGLPRHPARRQDAELRRRARGRGLQGDRSRQAGLHADGRLQPCQQQQAARAAGRRGARRGRADRRQAAAASSA